MSFSRFLVFSVCFAFVIATCSWSVAQDDTKNETKQEEKKPDPPKEYQFTVESSLECTDIKSQDQTGTCWSFATASFLESELIRQGKGKHNLSEMFIVKNIYEDKAKNYLLRQGKANFGEGALAHDFINAAKSNGLVPEEVFSGLIDGQEKHNHGEMSSVLQGMLDSLVKRRRIGQYWDDAYSAVLDTYMGASPVEFSYQGQTFTPVSFAQHLGFNADDYLSFTSYTHHPFNESFVLEIPDNFSNGSFQNVPIDRLVEIIDQAVEKGFTVAWDGDVSERGFSRSKGIAILPKKANRPDAFTVPGEELVIDQEMRQQTLETFSTTDDHLMHLVGTAKDQNGTKYYIIKNSWGESGPYKGYLYMSEAYLRLKTVAILVHKDAVSDEDEAKTAPTAATGQTTSR